VIYIAVLSNSNREIIAEPLLQYSPLFIGPMNHHAATYRRVNMKALARYQIILLGEQRHIDVNNLPIDMLRRLTNRRIVTITIIIIITYYVLHCC